MNEATTLDEVDRGLIHALHIDGRAPFGRIAAVLGVSTQTVTRRYRRLRETGLRVIGLPDTTHTGHSQWLVRLTTTTTAAQNLAHALTRRPDTSWVKLLSGGTEILFMADIPSHADPTKSLLLHDLPRATGITGVSAHLVLHTYHGGPTAWQGHLTALDSTQRHTLESALPQQQTHQSDSPTDPAAPEVASRSGSSGGAISPEFTPPQLPRRSGPEAALLGVLGRDGRATIGELAAATGWSQATVTRRLAELRTSGVLFFDVEFDDTLLGGTTQALLWMTVHPARLNEVATALAAHAEPAFVAATTGSTNLVAQALCQSPAALHRYLTGPVGALEAIQTLETTPVLQTLKAGGRAVSDLRAAVPVHGRRGRSAR
ncbi:AsnC family transcriptional regulator [Nocardia sp. NPDC051030]|uniref:Lrp/AsnC family transcriptional regulator n=1 Tax=Nocardia sp. NPDC051030 TaxID=3155162 RepID=UPI0034252132